MEIKKVIRLTPYQVKEFVSAATKCDFDVDISYNRFTVDAKSMLGVFGLNFDWILLELHSSSCWFVSLCDYSTYFKSIISV